MNSELEAVLAEFSPPPMDDNLGMDVKLGEPTPGQKLDEVIPARLEPERSRANAYFLTCVVLVCVLFVAQLAYIFLEIGHPARVQGSVAVFGASTFTLIAFLVRIVRNRERITTIISLSRELGPDELRATLGVLRDEWFPTPRPRRGRAPRRRAKATS